MQYTFQSDIEILCENMGKTWTEAEKEIERGVWGAIAIRAIFHINPIDCDIRTFHMLPECFVCRTGQFYEICDGKIYIGNGNWSIGLDGSLIYPRYFQRNGYWNL